MKPQATWLNFTHIMSSERNQLKNTICIGTIYMKFKNIELIKDIGSQSSGWKKTRTECKDFGHEGLVMLGFSIWVLMRWAHTPWKFFQYMLMIFAVFDSVFSLVKSLQKIQHSGVKQSEFKSWTHHLPDLHLGKLLDSTVPQFPLP